MSRSRASLQTFLNALLPLATIPALSGCASTPHGPTYAQAVGGDEVPKNQSELVIYRPGSDPGQWRAPTIRINGTPTCDLPAGGFFTYKVTPGPTKIEASLWDLPGTSDASVEAQPGERYIVRLRYDKGKTTAGMLAGMVGLLVAEATSERSGPFDLDVISDDAAKAELAQVRKIDVCSSEPAQSSLSNSAP